MIYRPYSYINKNPFQDEPSRKENWGAVFGLLIFPMLFILTAFTFFKVIKGNKVLANVPYQNGGFLNRGTQVGVGGAPPTVAPTLQNDLKVYSSNFIKGSADGFISQIAYENGARVYLSAQAMYDQDCTKSGKTIKESQNITINKGVDTYSTSKDTSNDNTYIWTVNFNVSAPLNLCPTGYIAGKITDKKVEGRVFLTRDGGITQLIDTKTNLPIQIGLTP